MGLSIHNEVRVQRGLHDPHRIGNTGAIKFGLNDRIELVAPLGLRLGASLVHGLAVKLSAKAMNSRSQFAALSQERILRRDRLPFAVVPGRRLAVCTF